MNYDRLMKVTLFIIACVYLVVGYISEVAPKKINNLEWYLQVSNYLGLVLVFSIPVVFGFYFVEKYWKDER